MNTDGAQQATSGVEWPAKANAPDVLQTFGSREGVTEFLHNLLSGESSDVIRPTPQNTSLGVASRGLRAVRDIGNVVPLPEFLGGGLGNALFGQSPEEVENWSYGNSPLKERVEGVSPRYPDFKRGRAQNVVDVAFLPAAEAVGVAKLAGGLASKAGKGLSAAVKAATEGGVDMSRREVLRKLGNAAGAAAATTTGLGGLKELAKRLPKVLEREAPKAVRAVARRYPPPEFRSLEEALERYINGEPPDAVDAAFDAGIEWHRELYDMKTQAWKDAYAAGDDAYERMLFDHIHDPDWAGSHPVNVPMEHMDRIVQEMYDDPTASYLPF